MIGNRRQAWVLYGVMAALYGDVPADLSLCPNSAGTPILEHAGIETAPTAGQPGGNMEGKEVRFGIAASGLFADVTTASPRGSVNSHA